MTIVDELMQFLDHCDFVTAWQICRNIVSEGIRFVSKDVDVVQGAGKKQKDESKAPAPPPTSTHDDCGYNFAKQREKKNKRRPPRLYLAQVLPLKELLQHMLRNIHTFCASPKVNLNMPYISEFIEQKNALRSLLTFTIKHINPKDLDIHYRDDSGNTILSLATEVELSTKVFNTLLCKLLSEAPNKKEQLDAVLLQASKDGPNIFGLINGMPIFLEQTKGQTIAEYRRQLGDILFWRTFWYRENREEGIFFSDRLTGKDELFEEPVVTPQGKTYEKGPLWRWINVQEESNHSSIYAYTHDFLGSTATEAKGAIRSNLLLKGIIIAIQTDPTYVTNLLVCPLSHTFFRDPVIASDCNTYERFALTSYLKMNGERLPNARHIRQPKKGSWYTVYRNLTIKEICEAYQGYYDLNIGKTVSFTFPQIEVDDISSYDSQELMYKIKKLLLCLHAQKDNIPDRDNLHNHLFFPQIATNNRLIIFTFSNKATIDISLGFPKSFLPNTASTPHPGLFFGPLPSDHFTFAISNHKFADDTEYQGIEIHLHTKELVYEIKYDGLAINEQSDIEILKEAYLYLLAINSVIFSMLLWQKTKQFKATHAPTTSAHSTSVLAPTNEAGTAAPTHDIQMQPLAKATALPSTLVPEFSIAARNLLASLSKNYVKNSQKISFLKLLLDLTNSNVKALDAVTHCQLLCPVTPDKPRSFFLSIFKIEDPFVSFLNKLIRHYIPPAPRPPSPDDRAPKCEGRFIAFK